MLREATRRACSESDERRLHWSDERRVSVVVGCAVGLAVAAYAPRARAVEREHQIGAGVGGTAFVASGATQIDPTFDAHYTYGLSDAFNLMLEASYSLDPAKLAPDETHERPRWFAGGDVGAAYVFDVLSWVPYAGVVAGAYALGGGPLGHTKVLPDVGLALGLDYRVDRQWSVGVAAQQHMLFTELSSYPSFTQVLARFEYSWGW